MYKGKILLDLFLLVLKYQFEHLIHRLRELLY